MRIFLARHGETAWNLEGRWQGHTDIPLSARGRSRRGRWRRACATLGIGHIRSSDLTRARETAEIVARELGIAEVMVDPRLRERSFGVFEGLTGAECAARFPDEWTRYQADRRCVPPGGRAAGAGGRAPAAGGAGSRAPPPTASRCWWWDTADRSGRCCAPPSAARFPPWPTAASCGSSSREASSAKSRTWAPEGPVRRSGGGVRLSPRNEQGGAEDAAVRKSGGHMVKGFRSIVTAARLLAALAACAAGTTAPGGGERACRGPPPTPAASLRGSTAGRASCGGPTGRLIDAVLRRLPHRHRSPPRRRRTAASG